MLCTMFTYLHHHYTILCPPPPPPPPPQSPPSACCHQNLTNNKDVKWLQATTSLVCDPLSCHQNLPLQRHHRHRHHHHHRHLAAAPLLRLAVAVCPRWRGSLPAGWWRKQQTAVQQRSVLGGRRRSQPAEIRQTRWAPECIVRQWSEGSPAPGASGWAFERLTLAGPLLLLLLLRPWTCLGHGHAHGLRAVQIPEKQQSINVLFHILLLIIQKSSIMLVPAKQVQHAYLHTYIHTYICHLKVLTYIYIYILSHSSIYILHNKLH